MPGATYLVQGKTTAGCILKQPTLFHPLYLIITCKSPNAPKLIVTLGYELLNGELS
jgi:hypothetical protein